MKLPGFPVGFQEETFGSVVAHYLARSAGTKSRILKTLGLYVTSARSIIPQNLSHFVSVMPAGHPWENAPEIIARSHTLVPLFLHFAHPERAAATLNAIAAGKSKNPAASLGIPANMYRILSLGQKFCPDCLANDLKAHGYPLLYRHHQAPFVKICAVHARPLNFNCLNCRYTYKAVGRWQMAGHCGCNEPYTPPVLEKGVDAKTEEAWLWLSRQVATILAAPGSISRVHVGANLLRALRNGGFGSKVRSGLDLNALTEALIDRFGEPLLKQLGVGRLCELPRLSSALRLTRGEIDGRSIPSVLRMLLLTRLVTDDIVFLWNTDPFELTPNVVVLPQEYPRGSKSERKRISKDAIASALDAAKGKIIAAAKLLGVGSSVLAANLRYHRIRQPLSEATSNKLGRSRIAAVREALALGVPKDKIQRICSVSEWSVLLIELDQPELVDAHRDAIVRSRREKHRNTLLSFLRDNPDESRRRFAKHCVGSYQWLGQNDRAWLKAHLPKPRLERKNVKRRAVKDWHQLDLSAVEAVRRTAREELAKPDRPIWISRTRLLSAAGASAALHERNKGFYPKAIAEAEQLAETREQLICRTIRWGLRKYAGLHKPISVNLLRRVARLSPSQLRKHRPFIIELATELELTFDARSELAPWRYHANDSPALTNQRSNTKCEVC